MENLSLLIFFAFVLFQYTSNYGCKAQDKFDENYRQTWGGDNLIVSDQSHCVQLQLDESSGSGFISKVDFGSGLFEIQLKAPNKDAGGVVTSYYLTSIPDGKVVNGVNHFEFGSEIFGRNLSTTAFANAVGDKVQQFNLWFDPSADFYKYKILWNEHQIAWFVDGEPLRVWKNVTTQLGVVPFPTQVALYVEASILNESSAGVVDWSKAPFVANFKDFIINACAFDDSNPRICLTNDTSYAFWNGSPYWKLNDTQQAQLANHRQHHLYYDYCNDSSKAGPECDVNK